MKKELVSIIIPVYNSEKYIVQTLESVEHQTYQNYEIIIIDDKSTDNSVDIIEDFCKKNNKIKLIKLQKNIGSARARNIGIRNAKGQYLCFLDSDDIFLKNKLELQVEFIKKHEFIYGKYKYINYNCTKISNAKKVPIKTDYYNSLGNMRILLSTVMIDLEKIPKRYCYMPDVDNEDIATWWKILKKGYYAYGQDEVLTLYRKTKKSRSSNKIKIAKGRWYIYTKIEKLSFFKNIICFIKYIIVAFRKRLVLWHKFENDI